MKIFKFKMVFALLAAVFLYGGISITGNASTIYNDTESNDTQATAQLIQRNARTAAQVISADWSMERYVLGALTEGDEDWYMISLNANERNYLTITGTTGTGANLVDMVNSNGTILESFSYTSNSNNENVFNITVRDAGIYYFRVYKTSSANTSYKLVVGNPNYLMDQYLHIFNSATLPAKGTWTSPDVNPTQISSIPNEAIAYQISVIGCTSTVSPTRHFRNTSNGNWVQTKAATFTYDLPVVEASSRMNQNWSVRYTSTNASNQTITARMSLWYIYPALPANER